MIILSGILFITFIVLFLVPSGKACPKCASHSTEHLKNTINWHGAKRKAEISYCFKCENKWGVKLDGKEYTEQQLEEAFPHEDNTQ